MIWTIRDGRTVRGVVATLLLGAAGAASSCAGDDFTSRGAAGTAGSSAGTSGSGTSGSDSGGSGGSGGKGGSDGGGGESAAGGDDAGGMNGTGGSAATGAGGATSGASGSGGNAGKGPTNPCDSSERPVADAVFVSPSGSASNDGSAQFPVDSLRAGITKAKANLVEHVYVAVGEYNEPATLELGKPEAGLVIEGGWTKQGATWHPSCEPDRRLLTTISVAADIALRVADVDGTLALRHLTLSTKAEGLSSEGDPGESLFGIWLSGTDSALNLLDVEVVAGDGGAAGDAPSAVAASSAVECDGHTECCVSEAGCGDASGPNAPDEAEGGEPAGEGTFGDTGYVAAPGVIGDTGTHGMNGREGSPGQDLGATTCRVGGSCGACQTAGNETCPGTCGGGSDPTGSGPLVGEKGRCGCAGLGGSGGKGGPGGGASVALLVTGGATVVVKDSALRAGDGGDGNHGGSGGDGAPGAAGVAGSEKSCTTGCYTVCEGTCGCDMNATATGGSAGTRGGGGGKGGPGGGGSGGPAYAVVSVGSAFDDRGGNALGFGAPGAGADGAKDGGKGELLEL